jgi:hypothetical protein
VTVAICPFAIQQIIPESHSQGRINPTTLIFHEAVSSADSLRDYWNSAGVEVESHFYIGRTGLIYQFVDTNVRADANVDANGFAVSVESWDDSNRNPLLGWNEAMVAAAKRLAAWVCDTHGIRKGPATSWAGGGIGGHNWFPYPWAGGPRQCPGETRNAQLRNEIIPAVANGFNWHNDEVDELANSDEILAAVQDLRNDFSTRWRNSGNTDSSGNVLDRMGWMFPPLDNDWIAKQPGAVVPWSLTNANASTYRATFERVLPMLEAIGAAIAQLSADESSAVSLDPAQLAALKASTGASIAEQMRLAQVQLVEQFRLAREANDQRFAELIARVEDDSELDTAALVATLREFYSRLAS